LLTVGTTLTSTAKHTQYNNFNLRIKPNHYNNHCHSNEGNIMGKLSNKSGIEHIISGARTRSNNRSYSAAVMVQNVRLKKAALRQL